MNRLALAALFLAAPALASGPPPVPRTFCEKVAQCAEPEPCTDTGGITYYVCDAKNRPVGDDYTKPRAYVCADEGDTQRRARRSRRLWVVDAHVWADVWNRQACR